MDCKIWIFIKDDENHVTPTAIILTYVIKKILPIFGQTQFFVWFDSLSPLNNLSVI